MKLQNYILILFFILLPLIAQAQQGPNMTCVNCDNYIKKVEPVSGSWFNPEQSGTGYILDVKKEYISGLYFGYDQEGEPIWLSFQGPLEPSEDSDVNWTLDVPLVSISGGNAYNQEYQLPESEETADRIKLTFYFSHFASVQVNDGEVQNIIPVNYAVPTTKDFEETDQVFPDLEGTWMYMVSENAPEWRLFAYTGIEFYVLPKEVTIAENGTKTIRYGFLNSSHIPSDQVIFSGLNCSNPFNQETMLREVICWIEGTNLLNTDMTVAPGDIGQDYVFSQNEDGDIVELIRYNHFQDDEFDQNKQTKNRGNLK